MPTGSRFSALSLRNFVTVMEIAELEHAGYVSEISQLSLNSHFLKPFDVKLEKIKCACFEAKDYLHAYKTILHAPNTESKGCDSNLCRKISSLLAELSTVPYRHTK